MNLNSIADRDLQTVKNMLVPKIRTHIIFLDGRNRFGVDSDGVKNDTDNKLVWYLNYGKYVWEKGYINITKPIANIVSVELNSISFTDRKSVDDYGYENTRDSLLPLSDNDLYMSNQRISILIQELEGQALLSAGGSKYHFITKRKEFYNDTNVLSDGKTRGFPTFTTDVSSGNKYKFYNPMSEIDRITLQIKDPDYPIIMDKEIYYSSSVTYFDPAAAFPDSHRIIVTFHEEPYINLNDIEISGFTTGNPVADKATIDSVNARFKPQEYSSPQDAYYTRITGSNVEYKLSISSIGITPLLQPPTLKIVVRNNFRAMLRINCLDLE